MIYHMEPYEVEFEKWEEKNMASQMGRIDPIATGILTLHTKQTGTPKVTKEEASAYSVKKEAQDLPAEFEALKRFNVTDADRSGDTKSLMRALSRRLYLVVKVHEQDFFFFFVLSFFVL